MNITHPSTFCQISSKSFDLMTFSIVTIMKLDIIMDISAAKQNTGRAMYRYTWMSVT